MRIEGRNILVRLAMGGDGLAERSSLGHGAIWNSSLLIPMGTKLVFYRRARTERSGDGRRPKAYLSPKLCKLWRLPREAKAADQAPELLSYSTPTSRGVEAT